MLPIIQSLWIGKKLSVLEQLALSSFVANGHQFHLYAYNDLEGVPVGVLLKDATAIIPESEIFSFKGGYAGFSDWFRWRLLNMLGNYWVDADLICLKPFDFKEEIIFGFEAPDLPGTAVIKFPSHHPLTSFMENRCEYFNANLISNSKAQGLKEYFQGKLLGKKRSKVRWGEAGGPIGFKQGLTELGLMQQAKALNCFYPVPYREWRSIFDGSLAYESPIFTNAYGLHLWNEMLRRNAIDKETVFQANSVIEQLKREYLGNYAGQATGGTARPNKLHN